LSRCLNGRRCALLIVGLAGCSCNLGWLADCCRPSSSGTGNRTYVLRRIVSGRDPQLRLNVSRRRSRSLRSASCRYGDGDPCYPNSALGRGLERGALLTLSSDVLAHTVVGKTSASRAKKTPSMNLLGGTPTRN
jgi:hypothetical protein